MYNLHWYTATMSSRQNIAPRSSTTPEL